MSDGSPTAAVETVETDSPAATGALGARLATELAGGGVVFLVGPLGAGKTLLAKAVFGALGIDETRVTSPTFQLVNRYRRAGPEGPALWHVDLYRIERAVDLESLGLDEMTETEAVILVEWAERLGPGRLAPTLHVAIDDLGGDRRRFTVTRSGDPS